MNKFFLLTLFAIATISCSPNINSDSESPIVEDLEVVNLDSISNIDLYVGVKAQFSANFLDNQELGSYKFDIHFAGDGHKSHINIEDKKTTNSVEWGFTKNGELSGTEQKVSFSKTVDEEAVSGPYHCVVYTVDNAGNAGNIVEQRFLVSNEDMPTYTITEPDFIDYKIVVGETMNVIGSAYGKKGLSKLAYIIRSLEDREADDLFADSEEISGDTKDVVIETSMVIPVDAPAGQYVLLLLASDQSGNVGEYYEVFEITN